MAATAQPPRPAPPPADLPRDQLLELYYWMRLTRSLEERLVNLYRQTKVVGGLFRSLGQEACAVGSAYALRREDVLSPLIRNLGSMLVKGATPLEVLRQYMAKGDSPTRGRELNIHFGDVEDRNFVGQISHLGDMVPVMAGVTLSLQDAEAAAGRPGVRGRRRHLHRRLPRGDQLRRGAALPARGRDRGEQPLRLLHPHRPAVRGRAADRQGGGLRHPRRARRRQRRARGVSGHPGGGGPRAARRGRDVDRAHDLPAEGPRGARQPVVRARRRDRPLGSGERPARPLREDADGGPRASAPRSWTAIDARVQAEIDRATDEAEASSAARGAATRSNGVYADPPRMPVLWYREGMRSAVERHERPSSWGTHDG